MALTAASKISAADAYKLATSPASAASVTHNVTVPELTDVPANKLWLWGAALAVVAALIIFITMYF